MSTEKTILQSLKETMVKVDGHQRDFGYYGHEGRTQLTDDTIINAYHHITKDLPSDHVVKNYHLDDLLNHRCARHCMDTFLLRDEDFCGYKFLTGLASWIQTKGGVR